jgi:acetyl esterase/lipase
MSLRQRQQPPTSSSTPTQSKPHRSKEGVKLPWYRPTLNLILARTLRFLGKFGYYLHNKRYKPNGIPVTRTMKVRMRDGHDIVLHIYEPSPSSASHSREAIPISRSELRPCVINFHGGGFTIGSGTDDSRWAHWCTRTSRAGTQTSGAITTNDSVHDTNEAGSNTREDKGLGAIFISIEYRLSPEYPHATPVNDCIDSTLYIINNAEEFGIDRNKVFLSGFSAGGSLAVTTALALSPSSPLDSSHTSLPNSTTTTTTTKQNQIAGVIAFYPVLDFNTPRSIKRQQALVYANSNTNSNGGKVTPLPGWMTRMFDTSYLPPHLSLDRMDPMISPGLAPSCKLETFPNLHLILCGADVLANEGREFGERLRNGEREVVVRTVPGARHGWDKPPLPLQSSVGEEYDAAIESMIRWCQ